MPLFNASTIPWATAVERIADSIGASGDAEMRARAHVTERIPAGTVWMRDGWDGLNVLTSGAPVLPDAATDIFGFSAGQATFDAAVEVAPATDGDYCA